MTHSSDDGRRELKGFAGLAAAALLGAFLLASAVLLSPAQAASAVCDDPVSVKTLRTIFPDIASHEGYSLEVKMGPIAAVVGANPHLDYSAVTSIMVKTDPSEAFIWFVEDDERACWATRMTAAQWAEIVGVAV